MNKIKEFFKKNWKLITIISAAVVAAVVVIVCCVCLIPGKDGENPNTPDMSDTGNGNGGDNTDPGTDPGADTPKDKTALATPANVAVDQDAKTLTWDAVANAASYTVKIGNETITVNNTTLNLADEAVVAKLVEGANDLYVKANAAADSTNYKDGEYCVKVTYTYTALAPELPAFDKPTGLSINEETLVLTWTAVDGATSYTVKINSDEMTVVTGKTTCNLIDTNKLVPNKENYISVKANATDDYKASEYSEVKSITYTPALSVEIDAYVKMVGDIDEINANSTIDQAKYVKSTIDLAKETYESLSPEAIADENVIAAKAEFDRKEQAYKDVYDAAETDYRSFRTALNTAYSVFGQKASLQSLSANVETTNSAYEGLGNLAKGMIIAEDNIKYEEVKTALTTWTTAVNTAKAAWEHVEIGELTDDTSAEAIIAALENIVAEYEDCDAYVMAEIEAEYTEAATALGNAKTQIDGTIADLKAEVDAIESTVEINIEYYNGLNDLRKKITALCTGEYGNENWDADDTAALAAEIDRVLGYACEVKRGDGTFGKGANGEVNIVREYLNVLGDRLALDTAPTVTYTVNGTGATETMERKGGSYVATIGFDPRYATTIEYTVSGTDEETKTLNYATFENNIWLNENSAEDEYRTMFNNNKLNMNQTYGSKHYADVYLATDVDTGGSDGTVTISGAPLAKISVENGMSLYKLHQQIALSEGGDKLIADNDPEKPYVVRFVFYSEEVNKVDDVDVVTMTYISGASVSEKITFNLTENDKNTPIDGADAFDVGVYGDANGTFSLIDANVDKIDTFLEQFAKTATITRDDAEKYFRIKITAYADEDCEGYAAGTELYSEIAPFRNQGYSYAAFKKGLTKWYFLNGGEDNGELKFHLTMEIQLTETVDDEDNPLAAKYRTSAPVNFMREGNPYPGTDTFHKIDATSPNAPQIAFEGNAITFVRDPMIEGKQVYGGNGKVFDEENHVKYIEVLFTQDEEYDNEKADEYYRFYLFWDTIGSEKKVVVYNSSDLTMVPIGESENANERYVPTDSITNSYDMDRLNLISWIEQNVVGSGITRTEQWYFYTKTVIDEEYLGGEENEYLYQGGYSVAIAIPPVVA